METQKPTHERKRNKPTGKQIGKTVKVIASKILFPYQNAWIFDNSRFKIACKARQIGLSLCLGLEGLLDVLNGQPVFYVSRTERQSIYLLEKFYRWCDYLLESGVPLDFDFRNRNECRVRVDGVGVDVKSLTSHAAGDEGYTGNVYLDEFGLHENDEQIFRSLFPTISWGYKIRIVSRPFGQSNKFYEIFTDAERYPDFKRYRFDIHRAIRDGLRINVDELRRNFDDEGFRENYLCEFIDESTSYLPYQLIRSCVGDLYSESDGGGSGPAPLGRGDSRGARYLGVDVGRKRDRTVVFVLAQLDDRFVTTRIERLQNERFDAQKAVIRQIINEEGITRGCIDATGLGMQLAEELQDEFGFIEPVTFTADSKERMAVRTKRVFENRQIQIPGDNDLISSIHSIRKLVTPSNNIRFDAERTADSHADDFWALALALEAATGRDNMPQLSFIEIEQQEKVMWNESD